MMVLCWCRLVQLKGQYPELILQRSPCLVTIPVPHLITYLSQGPPLLQPIGSSLAPSSSNTLSTSSSSSSSSNTKAAAHHPKIVVCHSDQAVPKKSALKYSGLVASTMPHPVVCCSKLCVNPKCLYYATQAQNAMTGNHHRTQINRRKRQFFGSDCDPYTCVRCARHTAAKHKRQQQQQHQQYQQHQQHQQQQQEQQQQLQHHPTRANTRKYQQQQHHEQESTRSSRRKQLGGGTRAAMQ